jgi:hypothetical protein
LGAGAFSPDPHPPPPAPLSSRSGFPSWPLLGLHPAGLLYVVCGPAPQGSASEGDGDRRTNQASGQPLADRDIMDANLLRDFFRRAGLLHRATYCSELGGAVKDFSCLPSLTGHGPDSAGTVHFWRLAEIQEYPDSALRSRGGGGPSCVSLPSSRWSDGHHSRGV